MPLFNYRLAKKGYLKGKYRPGYFRNRKKTWKDFIGNENDKIHSPKSLCQLRNVTVTILYYLNLLYVEKEKKQPGVIVTVIATELYSNKIIR